ncbi:MAG TPA: putative toxin-antitoxin system toxin component, PIN family [Candidatus Saccharimonadales bacterium]|nr:putative toxin-antitoxin system toxin component, PIN family [Candidatus Saccharimonadales bacterium]
MQLKTVFDSNIYIAAALRPGGYADVWLDIAALPRSGLDLYISHPILDEVREKLIERFGMPVADVDRFMSRLRHIVVVVRSTEHLEVVRDDPDDNAILECAFGAQAHLIISADHHLLDLNPYRGLGIAHPKELKRIFAKDIGSTT